METKFLKLLSTVVILLSLSGCGSDDSSEPTSSTVNNSSSLECTDLLNDTTIRQVFTDATLISQKPTSQSNRYCSYSFQSNGIAYETYLSIGLLGTADESTLEQSTSWANDRFVVDNLGDKSYIYTLGNSQQISVLSNSNLIHCAVNDLNSRSSYDNFYETETIEMIRLIIAEF